MSQQSFPEDNEAELGPITIENHTDFLDDLVNLTKETNILVKKHTFTDILLAVEQFIEVNKKYKTKMDMENKIKMHLLESYIKESSEGFDHMNYSIEETKEVESEEDNSGLQNQSTGQGNGVAQRQSADQGSDEKDLGPDFQNEMLTFRMKSQVKSDQLSEEEKSVMILESINRKITRGYNKFSTDQEKKRSFQSSNSKRSQPIQMPTKTQYLDTIEDENTIKTPITNLQISTKFNSDEMQQ